MRYWIAAGAAIALAGAAWAWRLGAPINVDPPVAYTNMRMLTPRVPVGGLLALQYHYKKLRVCEADILYRGRRISPLNLYGTDIPMGGLAGFTAPVNGGLAVGEGDAPPILIPLNPAWPPGRYRTWISATYRDCPYTYLIESPPLEFEIVVP